MPRISVAIFPTTGDSRINMLMEKLKMAGRKITAGILKNFDLNSKKLARIHDIIRINLGFVGQQVLVSFRRCIDD